MFTVEVRIQDAHEVHHEEVVKVATFYELKQLLLKFRFIDPCAVQINVIPDGVERCSMFDYPCQRGEEEHQWVALDEGDAESGPPSNIEVRCFVCGVDKG